MASANKKVHQDGTITYRIFVNGYNPKTNKNDKNYSETWRVPDGLTPKEIKRELERETIRFADVSKSVELFLFSRNPSGKKA